MMGSPIVMLRGLAEGTRVWPRSFRGGDDNVTQVSGLSGKSATIAPYRSALQPIYAAPRL